MSEAAAGWSRLHHGIDPRGNRLLWGWLRGIWWLAAPLARLRVPPLALTVLGALLAVVAAAGHWPWPAFGLIAGSVLCDALDGAVALLGEHATVLGARADKLADRIADLAFVVVLWRCGAPALLAAAAAASVLAVERLREWRGGLLRAQLTVAERPSRVICVLLACLCAAVSTAHWPATVCAAVLVGLSVIALAQLTRRARATSGTPVDADGASAG
ncbi:CDP-alcohol phosphatidyltransferase family protein [Jatrophihabitans sp.]|uniref:CDP-alcohol phosphatidyltransferase family protein n=1 Tax=Jatrophihabitans sp. TaxID=1932789 RepID=UPI0030C6FFA3|nr:CDP-alcohol phosphatidyltransferase family protein [Jatrophihabitans sp.]